MRDHVQREELVNKTPDHLRWLASVRGLVWVDVPGGRHL